MNVLFKCDSRTYLIVCVLLNVQRCISHVYSGQEQVSQIYSQEEGMKQRSNYLELLLENGYGYGV